MEAERKGSSDVERLELAEAAVELARRQMRLAARVIAEFYDAERNEFMTAELIQWHKEKVFAIGADFRRIASKAGYVRKIK